VVDIGKENFFDLNQIFSILISSSSKTSTSYSGGGGNDNSDAQKRFSNAKAISSDQFFNKASDVKSKILLCEKS
jgi:hypothetical protein